MIKYAFLVFINIEYWFVELSFPFHTRRLNIHFSREWSFKLLVIFV